MGMHEKDSVSTHGVRAATFEKAKTADLGVKVGKPNMDGTPGRRRQKDPERRAYRLCEDIGHLAK